LFITSLCKIILKEPNEELSLLLTDLNYEMAEKKGRDKTLSTYVNQLTKRFYLTLETTSASTSISTLDFENKLNLNHHHHHHQSTSQTLGVSEQVSREKSPMRTVLNPTG
jgi:hypothetical protein